MHKQPKRILALVMALSVLISLFSMTVSAQETAGTLTLDQTTNVTSQSSIVYVAFTPAESDTYVFYSQSDADTYAELYDSSMHQLTQDDDNGEDNNFSIAYALEAGQTYYLGVRFYNSAAGLTIPVRVEKSPILRIDFDTIEIIENHNGHMETDPNGESWFHYYWTSALQYTVYFQDGTSQHFSGSQFEWNGKVYQINHTSDDQYQNHWTLGNTYEATVTLAGFTSAVSVAVVETPVTSIVARPATIMVGTKGYTTHGYDQDGNRVEYYEYHWYTEIEADVTLKNGQSFTVRGNQFQYNGQTMHLDYNIGQSWDNPWQADNTYDVHFSVLGYPCQTTVTIEGSPLLRIEVDPITVTEGNNGRWETGYDPDTGTNAQYYYYNWTNLLSYRVYFKDGTSQQVYGGGFTYKDQYYGISYSHAQSITTPWLVNGTYEQPFSVMGTEASVAVTISPSPIASIVMDPLTIAEHTNGYYTTHWEGNVQTEYYRYSWYQLLSGTVTFTDGTSQRFGGTGFYYNDQWFNLSYTDDQYHDPMTAGNTYTKTLTCGILTTTVDITIAQPQTAGKYQYILNGGNAIITDCTDDSQTLTIPSVLDGRPVVGISALGENCAKVKELIIPDSVTMLSFSAFDNLYHLEKLHLGAGITQFDPEVTWAMEDLQSYSVSAANPSYTVVDGVLYNKNITTMIAFPHTQQSTHVIPDSVTDISAIFTEYGNRHAANVQTGAGTPEYVTVDGIVYSRDMSTIYSCAMEKTGDYVMPESVTQIARYGLAGASLNSVSISPNVTNITYGSFAYSKLKTIKVPESITEVGPLAFDECYTLEALDVESIAGWCQMNMADAPKSSWELYSNGTKVTDLQIPDVVTVVYDSVFTNVKLDSVTFPSTVAHIGVHSFYGADVPEVNFSEGLEFMGYGAFRESTVRSVALPDSLTTMEEGRQFADCEQLETLTIGTGLEYISYCAFRNTAIRELVLPANITYIDTEAFEDCVNLAKVDFQNPEIYIGYRAFYDCPLEKIELGDGVEYIEDRAFAGNKAVTLVIPDSVTAISYRCFERSENLISVVIPESVTSIDPNAFDKSYNIKHVYYGGTQTQWDAIEHNSYELLNANLHPQTGADAYVVNYTCTRVEHYCRICGIWEYVEYDTPRHNMENGVCTLCGETTAQKNGWVETKDGWTYYRHGVQIKDNWVNDNGWFYMDANGYMKTNAWVRDSIGWCYVGQDGRMVFNKWVEDSIGWCYVDKTGYMGYNLWIKDGHSWYYVDGSGYMLANTSRRIGNKTYRFNASGICTNP